jgi:ATP-binding cassette subfamily F protein 3
MHIITIDHLTITQPDHTVFSELSWAISDRERTGLVGPNGAGKSTLIRAIAGIITPDSGFVHRPRPVRIGYLPQEVTLPPGRTLIETVMSPPPRLAQIEAQLRAIEDQLGDPAVYGDPDRLAAALEDQERALNAYASAGGDRHAGRVRDLLRRLGFMPEDDTLPVESLSGGQKKLIALILLAVEAPEALLLDEPDNHLDLTAKAHLERFIRDYEGAVVIISHDRYLLDEAVTKIAELEDGRLTIYPGTYTAYAEARELRRLRQQQLYVSQQKRVVQIQEAIKRFDMLAKVYEDAGAARKARHRRRMLERMEANGEMIDRVRERRLMDLQLEGGRGSQKAIELRGVTMAFDDDPLFLDLDLRVEHGERVGLIGPNGAGKSVLFRLILGQLAPVEGQIIVGPGSRIGYYAQEHQTLAGWEGRTPIDLLRDARPMPEDEAVTHLLKFAFAYRQARQPIGTLSGGERARLQLLRLVLMRPNLLLLDEPTNNLDIPSVEVLESALEDFEGAVLAISHDRYFLDRVVDRVVELRDGTLTPFPGGYSDFLAAQSRRR